MSSARCRRTSGSAARSVRRQAESLVDLAAALDGGAVIVGGDLNATPDMRAVRRISAVAPRYVDRRRATARDRRSPPVAPAARIDYVFVGGRVQVGARAGGDGRRVEASDHLPVAVGSPSERGGRARESVLRAWTPAGVAEELDRHVEGEPARPPAPGTSACWRRTIRGSPTGRHAPPASGSPTRGHPTGGARGGQRRAPVQGPRAPSRWGEGARLCCRPMETPMEDTEQTSAEQEAEEADETAEEGRRRRGLRVRVVRGAEAPGRGARGEAGESDQDEEV